jgi:hypothetical protein
VNKLAALGGTFRAVLGGSVQLVSAPDGTDFLVAAVFECDTTTWTACCRTRGADRKAHPNS